MLTNTTKAKGKDEIMPGVKRAYSNEVGLHKVGIYHYRLLTSKSRFLAVLEPILLEVKPFAEKLKPAGQEKGLRRARTVSVSIEYKSHKDGDGKEKGYVEVSIVGFDRSETERVGVEVPGLVKGACRGQGAGSAKHAAYKQQLRRDSEMLPQN